MGGLLHLFDFHQIGISWKSITQNRHDDGLEAPRNSLDMPKENLQQTHDAMDEYIPYSYQVKQNSSKQKFYPSGAPMKKLIDAEISKEPEVKHNVPSVVARLMGMDMLPSETKPTVNIKEKKREVSRNGISGKQTEKSAIRHSSLDFKCSLQDASLDCLGRDLDEFSDDLILEKPRPREHPQEEQLQKFKKEFEAWQAARVWENSRVLDLDGCVPRQCLAQEPICLEKMALNTDSNNRTANGKHNEPRGCNSQLILNPSYSREKGGLIEKPKEPKGHNLRPVQHLSYSLEKSGLKDHGFNNKEPLINDQKVSMASRNRTRTSDLKHVPSVNCDERRDRSAIPTRIVILRPGPDSSISTEESWPGSSEIVEEGSSIEGFLEEVKERLKFEIQGKNSKRVSVARQLGTETPLGEKPSSPRQIARHIAKQVRESVSRDLGMDLIRSESIRSYRSEIQIDGPSSPEFINRDTRKFLSERLRNVLKEDLHLDVPPIENGGMRSSLLNSARSRQKSADFFNIDDRLSYWENAKEPDLLSSSFRYQRQNEFLHVGNASPRNLLRSLSAPVSGTSFGKLLLEDRHVLTGAHIRRKHEDTGNVSVDVRKTRKDRFSFKGKVSNFRYRFTLKSKLFGRKIESVDESWSDDSDSVKDIMSGPTLLVNLGNAQENSTEVPPSPASVCSSPRDEFCRVVEQPSPISILDIPMMEDHTVSRTRPEISSNLHEFKNQLNQPKNGKSEDLGNIAQSPRAEIVELEGQAEAYIKDLLVVSGLYDRLSKQTFSGWDSLSSRLCKWVFDKVEESYPKNFEENTSKKDLRDNKIDHKVLFDLLNESLSTILGPSMAMSTFKKNVVGPVLALPPHGKDLIHAVWKMIHKYVYTPCEDSFYSLDSLVTHDLETLPWLHTMHDCVDLIGRDVEDLIIRELIEETVKEICSY
ncbi:hypothetical protein Syun_014987 [Stephania yunnanensis]|uniref:DUF4378 domain-containing protein n=1 Tax=Stephania yunnanensis TaxID=152371 RepID=A0AAP0JKI2_9MAGN